VTGMYVCMHVCLYAYVWIFMCMDVWMHRFKTCRRHLQKQHAYMCVCMYACMRVSMNVRLYVCLYAWMCVCTRT
jgi:hypothetical protein